ncbi:hypothetical protein ACCT26_12585 [Rhizobium ruizarguesonis]
MKVSRRVHLEVSLPVSQIQEQKKASGDRRQPSPGPYLVRSDSVYLFQIKLPKQICSTGDPALIRISMGARSHKAARRLADLLVARARILFDEAGRKAMTQHPTDKDEGGVEPMFSGETPEETVIEMRGALKAYLRMIDRPEAPFTPEELHKTAGIRDLVRLNQELAKRDDGRAYEEMLVENAELLKQRALQKLQGSTALQGAVPIAAQPAGPEQPASPPIESSQIWQPSLDEQGNPIPAFKLDRRTVRRRPSSRPLFSTIAATYLALRETALGAGHSNVRIARARLDVFLELIGDHPVDTYNGTDLQAFVDLMQYWPGDSNKRDPNMSVREVLANNQDLHLQPMAIKTFKEGYVSVVKTAARSGMTEHEYQDPFGGAKIHYPKTAAEPVSAQPLGASQVSRIFQTGVSTGFLDNAMLPLLGHLTGRRLGLLVHLTGNDFREKFDRVWVAQTSGIALINGTWKRVPYKTGASLTFFVLHEFLHEIGFVQWAMAQGDKFIFSEMMKLVDPSKSASSYMQRLFEKAGIASGNREVFHSLRGGQIEEMRDANVDARDRRMQAGHQLGDDEHDNYGFRNITEKRARELAKLRLNPEVDFSVFQGLDFGKLAAKKRTLGRASMTK